MPPLFRKRSSAAVADEAISDDILASIPDVGAAPSAIPTNPFAANREAPISPFGPLPAVTPVPVAGLAAEEDDDDDEDDDRRPIPLPASNAAPRWAVPSPTPLGAELTALVADVRAQMETAFSRELGKVEDGFAAALRQLEGRLDRANAEIEALRRENEALLRVKSDYDRKAEALKELARSFDKG